LALGRQLRSDLHLFIAEAEAFIDEIGVVEMATADERGERYLFWPMGIKSAGAMRQAGSQPTAFVGRRHFDDADLVDKRFHLRDE
jgi:hypothetical protein